MNRQTEFSLCVTKLHPVLLVAFSIIVFGFVSTGMSHDAPEHDEIGTTLDERELLKEDYWTFTKDAKHHLPIVEVSLDGAIGAGVIIYVDNDKPIADGFEGLCLTAYHVVKEDNHRRAIKVSYRNGQNSTKCKILEYDEELDVAVLWVWVPSSIRPAKLGKKNAQHDDEVEFAGLGGGRKLECCIRHFKAKVSSPTNEDEIYADAALLAGDSGGPVFNKDNEVVGIISGGWFWWDGKVRGNPVKATWPARACNLSAIRKVYERTKSSRLARR